ncbi:hypothetical protein [Rubinisphaera margarita]|uniref:hypothetical protein n=1 Tax=Rubinisphaera margarita TaxID=2909586 RepID=UPI001EE972F5|nr:hypothetical protein [Rubinisphaera margarita]MCG6154626.1 hypothetical protein [Rubinisphaera margarita]
MTKETNMVRTFLLTPEEIHIIRKRKRLGQWIPLLRNPIETSSRRISVSIIGSLHELALGQISVDRDGYTLTTQGIHLDHSCDETSTGEFTSFRIFENRSRVDELLYLWYEKCYSVASFKYSENESVLDGLVFMIAREGDASSSIAIDLSKIPSRFGVNERWEAQCVDCHPDKLPSLFSRPLKKSVRRNGVWTAWSKGADVVEW